MSEFLSLVEQTSKKIFFDNFNENLLFKNNEEETNRNLSRDYISTQTTLKFVGLETTHVTFSTVGKQLTQRLKHDTVCI